ncbi:isocitrate/isopropylmalate dehydrogenase family protein [Kibdelosporangium philippinense]|uniref:Isocitrate/isopropylmalate dehydrogenase family protein n=1 Tax=Kibdelosporangium philippinense TaxID=211113 RepID=A0ABS8ZB84_9PSEU|nr:isocitrate/isopropylmalate dehydrogenase family protein [Kibdelosporangium philippinense]MCE7004757.1 isocitrate/isopropylmalate dehydrogenase family protein [Kibdelosporangium philippinense]
MSYRVAVIRGDGIGPELVDSALAVLEAVADVEIVEVRGGAAAYLDQGTALAEADLEVILTADATLKGPVGLPDVRLPDGTEAGLLGGILRNGLDLYANVRPITLLPGVRSALRVDDGIDYVIVRENTEGLYASRGKGVGNSQAMADTLLVTRAGSERIARYAFELASTRQGAPEDGVRRVTCVDKANVLRSMFFFRSVFLEVAAEYPGIEAECVYVDAAAQALVMSPRHFDVIVTESMFGDILSDLGGGTIGGVALCPGGNIGASQAYFEPIHGSAPSIAGQDKANPLSQILATAMMLDHLGAPSAGDRIRAAVRQALSNGSIQLNPDGTTRTRAVTEAVIGALT